MRYAIYFIPDEDSPLEAAASSWLGRSIYTGKPLPQTANGLEMQELTATARRYGLHGTIVAPFRPVEGMSEQGMIAALESFCAGQQSFLVANVIIAQMDGFFAIQSATEHPLFNTLASEAVKAFQPFKAPLTEAEIARRKPEALSERQRQYLMRWGYPYVMDEFRFHMTLTRETSGTEAAKVADALRDHFALALRPPMQVSALTLCREDAPGAPFEVVRQVAFEHTHARKTLSHV